MGLFFFNDTATTEIYTLSLHDALPISSGQVERGEALSLREPVQPTVVSARDLSSPTRVRHRVSPLVHPRSEEHTSELQSRQYLVCRLLLEKKKSSRRAHALSAVNLTEV